MYSTPVRLPCRAAGIPFARARARKVHHGGIDYVYPGLGLFGHILPLFKAKTGIDVKVISQGTGQALDTGRRGDADVVFVHAGRRRKNLSPTALA